MTAVDVFGVIDRLGVIVSWPLPTLITVDAPDLNAFAADELIALVHGIFEGTVVMDLLLKLLVEIVIDDDDGVSGGGGGFATLGGLAVGITTFGGAAGK